LSKFKAIPSETRLSIKEKAEAEWPHDYEMQLHIIEEQSNSFLEYSFIRQNTEANDLLERLFILADDKWPDDFAMRLHEFNSQLEAVGKFFEFDPPNVPSEVVEDIKTRAFLEWDNDFSMCLHHLETQIAAYIELNEI
jgi:hypothetical protein